LSYLLYSFVLALGMLLSLPYWLYQVLRHGKYRRGFAERMGKVPVRLGLSEPSSSGRRVIWIHAVSLGEVLAVSGLVGQLRRAFPQHRVVVSTTTDTGQRVTSLAVGSPESASDVWMAESTTGSRVRMALCSPPNGLLEATTTVS